MVVGRGNVENDIVVKRKKLVIKKRKKEFEEINGELHVELNRNMLVLLMLARMMRLDLRILLFLWEKYREDLFFWFFMFAGLKVKFPSLEGMLRIFNVVDLYLDKKEIVSGRCGWYLSEVLSKEREGKIVLDLGDMKYFRLGRLGVMMYEKDSIEEE